MVIKRKTRSYKWTLEKRRRTRRNKNPKNTTYPTNPKNQKGGAQPANVQEWIDRVNNFAPLNPSTMKDLKDDALLLPDIDPKQGQESNGFAFLTPIVPDLQTAGSESTLLLSAFLDETPLEELTFEAFNAIILKNAQTEDETGTKGNPSLSFLLDVENELRYNAAKSTTNVTAAYFVNKEEIPRDVRELANSKYQPLYIWALMVNLSKNTAALSPTEMIPTL